MEGRGTNEGGGNMGKLKETEKVGSTRAAWVDVTNKESNVRETGIDKEQIPTLPNKENGQKQHTIGGRPSDRPRETQ